MIVAPLNKDVCVPNPCINGGTCKREVLIHPGHIHVSAEFTCVCPPGFAPPDCRNKTDDPCVPNPCLNGGKCQKDPSSTNGYICKCLGPHFVPPKCRCDCPQGDPSQKPPILASKCDLAGECVCPVGYTFQAGVGCKSGRQNPCFEKPCLNNGTCVPEGDKYRCICTENCKGNICQTCDFCPPDYCFNGGTCYSVGHKPYCRCRNEFLPPRCLFKKPVQKVYHCHPNPCHNGGKCIERVNGFDCQCVPPFDGPHCEHDKCMDCDVHALCIHGQCKCRRGFRGSGYKGDCIKESVCPICPVNAMCVDNGCECVPGFMLVKQKCIPVMTP
ncbi:fibropellin-1-like [Actinia tenebrosa]|uniref:Fibropellin-1-like n=1 Tax=Actinia tenebrosa TaxID=6105 RepID=A0A6P8IFV9_ACTTE|nr:fibropellin-1-like [Actinia tenebrosa]